MASSSGHSGEANVQVSVSARTDVGMRRSGNEDAFIVADLTSGNFGLGPEVSTHKVGERGSLIVVSDGMGGAAAGEVASEMAVKVMREALMEAPAEMEVCDQLNRAVEIANDRIWKHAKQNVQLSGMGATLTAVLLWSKYAYIAQVGDSRAYLVRGDRIKQLTKDQSLVQMLLESGAIEPDQADSVPHNVIMQALGTSPTVDPAMTVAELCKNDVLVLCSDGLSNKVGDEEIRDIVNQSDGLSAACRRLIELANERGGEDNITVVAATFDGEELHSAGESNSITGSFRILDNGCLGGELSKIGDQFRASSSGPPAPDTEDLGLSGLPEFQPGAATQAGSGEAPSGNVGSTPAESGSRQSSFGESWTAPPGPSASGASEHAQSRSGASKPEPTTLVMQRWQADASAPAPHADASAMDSFEPAAPEPNAAKSTRDAEGLLERDAHQQDTLRNDLAEQDRFGPGANQRQPAGYLKFALIILAILSLATAGLLLLLSFFRSRH